MARDTLGFSAAAGITRTLSVAAYLNMKHLLFALLLLTLATAAWAEWVKFGEDSNYASYYYDPDTIEKDGRIVRVWEIQDLVKPERLGDLSRRMRNEYDCDEKRYRILSGAAYSEQMAGGRTLLSRDVPGKWQLTTPETYHEELIALLCK